MENKTQWIKKSDLKIIYGVICKGWQEKLQEILLWSEGKEVEISEEMLQDGYKAADASQKKLIEKYFTISTPKKLMDKIKNFQDVLDLAGVEEEDILPYKKATTRNQKRLNALAKIQLVEEVLNEGWVADFSNSDYKYYPYFEKKAGSGWVCNCYVNLSSFSIAVAIYFKTSELATFAGKTFIKEYQEFIN